MGCGEGVGWGGVRWRGGGGVLGGGANNVLVYERSCIFVLDTLFTFASHGLTRGRCFGFDMLMLVSGGVWACSWVWGGLERSR